MQAQENAKKQILVVEDEGLIAADVQNRLERLGYAVPAVAHSGEEAVQLARSRPFDLVLMDIRLKGEMDGITAAAALRSDGETPVVYLTAHADQDTIQRAKVTEPFGYVLKPIGDGDLRSAVEIAIYKHEMERRLRTSEAWLSTTLRSIGDGVIATNTSGEIVFLNPIAQQLTGWPVAEAHGQQLMDVVGLFEESSGRPAKNPVYDLLGGETRNYSLISRQGAKTPVEVSCFENQSEDEVLGMIVVVRDISARRELESRLIQSQRMEAVANLAGGLAHDFNNQLTVMLGYAEELAARLDDGKQEAQEIQHAASIASTITRQLLTLSRHDLVQVEVLNLNEVICEMQPMISHSLGKTRTLATELGSPAGFIRADRNQLKQVLLNLAFNARDAMPGGGELRIESSTVSVDAAGADARLYRPGPYARLRISDCGSGMDAETLSHIFEPYFTTKKPALGTGLGLSIVHSIITQGDGYITATSQRGRGTCFDILMPSVGMFQGTTEWQGGRNAAPGENARTVLLVEDEDNVRRLMHTYLEREGYQLLEARSGEEAESLVSAYREPIDILVTDVIMPNLTGPQLAERLSAARPGLKVLYVSGYRHDRLERDGVLDSGLQVLSKPFAGSELTRRVRVLLSQAVPVQS